MREREKRSKTAAAAPSSFPPKLASLRKVGEQDGISERAGDEDGDRQPRSCLLGGPREGPELDFGHRFCECSEKEVKKKNSRPRPSHYSRFFFLGILRIECLSFSPVKTVSDSSQLRAGKTIKLYYAFVFNSARMGQKGRVRRGETPFAFLMPSPERAQSPTGRETRSAMPLPPQSQEKLRIEPRLRFKRVLVGYKDMHSSRLMLNLRNEMGCTVSYLRSLVSMSTPLLPRTAS